MADLGHEGPPLGGGAGHRLYESYGLLEFCESWGLLKLSSRNQSRDRLILESFAVHVNSVAVAEGTELLEGELPDCSASSGRFVVSRPALAATQGDGKSAGV